MNMTHVVVQKKKKSPITWPVHDHLIYFTCSLHLKRYITSLRVHIEFHTLNKLPDQCIDIFWPGPVLSPFSLRDTRKGLNPPPCSAPCHCVSLAPSLCLPASICKWSRLSAYCHLQPAHTFINCRPARRALPAPSTLNCSHSDLGE